jgi:hypothetical protein
MTRCRRAQPAPRQCVELGKAFTNQSMAYGMEIANYVI